MSSQPLLWAMILYQTYKISDIKTPMHPTAESSFTECSRLFAAGDWER